MKSVKLDIRTVEGKEFGRTVEIDAYPTHVDGLFAHRALLHENEPKSREWVISHKVTGLRIPGIRLGSLADVMAVSRWLNLPAPGAANAVSWDLVASPKTLKTRKKYAEQIRFALAQEGFTAEWSQYAGYPGGQ